MQADKSENDERLHSSLVYCLKISAILHIVVILLSIQVSKFLRNVYNSLINIKILSRINVR